ncbi:uncharacterized protein IUM83_12377 [Phytophthora cinnamomi]|uniref:uncharacterized protein n=1 Tax=Phytophthora cinnamomi TaxID=4785 RepID=UPI00355A1FFE|nr:hypothetical protein IUM83_12377 [Phytophthora cinnamomi]
MKFFFQALAMVALLTSGAAADGSSGDGQSEGIILSQTFGERLGTEFTDVTFTTPREIVHSITIRSGVDVNGVGIDASPNRGPRVNTFHGGNIGTPKTLTLNSGERFNCLEAHWGTYHDHTRIMYIKITTTSGRVLEGGTRTAKTGKICAPTGFQLGGFIGYAGVELNEVGVVWTSN